jgi:CBS domain containing-hemolysin-like protein
VVEERAGVFLVTGKADIELVADRLGIRVEGDGFETFGGYILARLGRVPALGETFDLDDVHVEVVAAERRRLGRLRVTRRLADAGEPGAPAGPSGT